MSIGAFTFPLSFSWDWMHCVVVGWMEKRETEEAGRMG